MLNYPCTNHVEHLKIAFMSKGSHVLKLRHGTVAWI